MEIEPITETTIKTDGYEIMLKTKSLTPWYEILKGFVGQLKAQGYNIGAEDLKKLEQFWEEK